VTQADRGQIQRPAPQPAAPQPAAPQQPPAAESPAQDSPVTPLPAAADTSPAVDESSFDTQAGGDIVVQRGDTLWSISQRMRPDSQLTMNQMMLAINEANPQAFDGNINVLSAGASLRIPSADEVFRIARGDALAEVQRQHDSWGGTSAGFAPPSQAALELVPPDDDVVLFDDDAGQTAVDTVVEDFADPAESRIDQIEGWLIEHQNSVIEISSNELAALRAELADLRGEAPSEPLPTEEVASVAADDAVADDEPEPLVPDDDATAVDAVPEEVTLGVADTAPPAVAASPSEDSLIDTILGYVTSIWGIIGGALLVAMGLLVWFARRSVDAEEEDDATGTGEALDHDNIDMDTMASTERLRVMAREDDTAIVVVEQESATDEDDLSLLDTLDVPAFDPAQPTESAQEEAAAARVDAVDLLGGADLETLVAPLDDEATTLADAGASELADSAALPDDVDSADSSTEATGEMPGVSGSTDLDLDLDDLTAALKVSEIGETSAKTKIVDDAATVEQPMIAPGDIDSAASGALNDGRTMTEVGTKLDLARAYVDMGDPGGARSILKEVLDEGDDGQRQQAQQLLESLPS
jgi:pilus assembly protein FimV